MNRDDIIRMAREVGLDWLMHNQFYEDHLDRFADLVAAAEREACAKLAENWRCTEVAKAIRARGQA